MHFHSPTLIEKRSQSAGLERENTEQHGQDGPPYPEHHTGAATSIKGWIIKGKSHIDVETWPL